jgi:signal transduction histidine kinase
VIRSRDTLAELSGHVDAVLRWSAGTRRLKRRRIDVGRLVRRTVERETRPSEERRVSVLGEAGVTVSADSALVAAALGAAVRNALDYSPPGSPVTVHVQEREGAVRIAVRDRGPGVSTGERAAVFDPFVRGRNVGALQGSGLGLHIARRIMEAHGGRIWLEQGEGSTTVMLEFPGEGTGR